MLNDSDNTQPGVALVTGAAHRIGRAIALDLAANGWSVALHYNRSQTAAAELADVIVRDGGRAAIVHADLAIENQVERLVDHASDELGPVTCLINNASVFEGDTLESTTRASWNLHMEVNLRAPFVLIQRMAALLPPEAEGNAINLIDQRVWNLTPHFTSYTLSKSGLWTLTRTLAQALAPRIRVNAIGPGPTLPSIRQTETQFARQYASMPLQRPATPEEIARTALFILATPTMTGQMIALDAGQHLGWAQPVDGYEYEE
ncbi:MAG: SDR family oxidoreductase [Rhodospirillales bacterium]|nr:SDR family oxidoreductase [Rhodospirillales bacterium]